MKKTYQYIFILIVLTGILSPAQELSARPETPAGRITNYTLLAPLSDGEGRTETEIDTKEDNAIGRYLNWIIKIFIGLCAVLAVVMMVIGGMEYMTSELISSKESGRQKITDAILGLILALGAYAILFTINEDLLRTDVRVGDAIVNVDLGGESSDPYRALTPAALQAIGINCPGSGGKGAVENIGRQFIGKTTYSREPGQRNTINGSKVILDCSAFVSQVYECAGLGNPGGNTLSIFGGGGTPVDGRTYDFTKLNPGDLVGWIAGDNGQTWGHVSIYIGNGQVLDTQNTSNATQVRSLSSLKDNITFVKWPR